MKSRILIRLIGLLALVFYASLDARSQVVENPENSFHSVPTGADSNLTDIVICKFRIKGNNTHNLADALHLQVVPIELPQSLIDKANLATVDFYYVAYDDTVHASADVDKYGNTNLNVDVVLTPKFHDVYITTKLDPKNLKLGDTFEVKVALGIALDGETPSNYLNVDPQYLFYGKKETTSVYTLDKPVTTFYPNPFVNVINIDLPKIENITITNSVGQTVYTGLSGKIETTNFIPGVYFAHTPYGICKIFKH